MKKTIPEDLEILASAYSLNIETSNRAWVALISICLAAVLAQPSDPETMDIVGFAINPDFFHWVSVVVISALNIHYCSSQMMTYEFSKNFAQYLSDIDAVNIKVSKNNNLKEIAYKMVKPSYVRLFPLTLGMPKTFARLFMVAVKPLIDTLYTLLPVACILQQGRLGYLTLDHSGGILNWSFGLATVSAAFAVIAIFSSVIMAVRVAGWQRLLSGFR
ncbi:hypothetical protein [Yoonia maritima]|uniref:hypothetical protein n=1 Tax=Yoonia maritima TaxID=1435347 RepID=UPI000D1139D3|nr:hypothetical protein [Yoonia maritima]